MKVAVVFPPSLCLPNQLYHALPVLAGALRCGGHEPQITDLNLMAADLCLDRGRARRLLERGAALVGQRHREGDLRGATVLERMLEHAAPKVMEGEASKAVLRDPVRYFDQPAFKRAFWNVVDVLGIFYQLDPVISPHRETFAADMQANQAADPWTPLHEFYDEVLIEAVLGREPGMIAVTVAFPEQAVEAVRFARFLRRRAPQLHIAFGGPLITAFLDRWLEDGWIFDHVDSVCTGDGERTIVELADAVAAGRDVGAIGNLATRDASGTVHRPAGRGALTDLADAPLPDFHAMDYSLALTPEPIYPLMASRGCYWGRCTFCSIGWRENFRVSPRSLLRRDVVDLVKTYGARYVQVQDSSLPPRTALELARIVEEEGLSISWVAGMKFDKVFLDPEYCKALHRGGCRSLLLGFESSTQRIVDLMDKGFDTAKVPAMLANLRAAGISAELLWFVGFPTELRGEALETVRWLHRHRDLFGLSAFVSHYQLHPDTIIADDPERYGLVVTGQDNDRLLYAAESGM